MLETDNLRVCGIGEVLAAGAAGGPGEATLQGPPGLHFHPHLQPLPPRGHCLPHTVSCHRVMARSQVKQPFV